MLSRSFYFGLKPFLPWRLRIGVRRILARRIFQRTRAVWPIDEAAGRAPADWPAWPEGKQFAFVLTHDVEGPDGLEKIRRLAELEMQFGVRSSFNLIPEGPYTVPPDLRSWLTGHGFEVGVHDLHHDGKLFASRRGFHRNSGRINYYLREWGAAGFRSGFMVRDLDWIHDLHVQYDASTFDTDPFEIQPEGAGTIFPFWVPTPPSVEVGPKSQVAGHVPSQETSGSPGGYVELPYTLPQDSTLFFLLREAGPEIWMRKLAWIADRGGMALVNVHPDYVRFDGERASARTFPVANYAAWLRHVTDQYAGRFWNPVPRQLAGWYTGARAARTARAAAAPAAAVPDAAARLRGKRAAVLLYSYYPSDPRPRRAAEAMIGAGMTVDLLCLSEAENKPANEVINGVQVFRVPMKHRRDSKWTYFRQYSRFLVASLWFLSSRGLRRRYDVVHVHNMPDFLVFAALVPKLRGARVILDLHDPMPELMMSIYDLPAEHRLVRLLRRLERWSTRFAHRVLTPNLAFKKLFVSRGCAEQKISIVMNSPQPEIFSRNGSSPPPAGPDPRFRIMHHGLIAHRHGLDLLIEALAQLRPAIPGLQLDLYGRRTRYLTTVEETAARLGVADLVHYHGAKSQSEIAHAIGEADLGVVPNRRSAFTELNFPTRIFEYLAMGCPVIAPATAGIRDYFTDEQLLMFEPGSVDDLAARIRWVHANPAEARAAAARGGEVYRAHLWPEEKVRLLEVVAGMLPE